MPIPAADVSPPCRRSMRVGGFAQGDPLGEDLKSSGDRLSVRNASSETA